MPGKRTRAAEECNGQGEHVQDCEQESANPVDLPAEVLRQQKRKIAQRGVVERRAAHFARAQPSSTPTGYVAASSATTPVTSEGDVLETTEQKEAWCGPFATAHQLK